MQLRQGTRERWLGTAAGADFADGGAARAGGSDHDGGDLGYHGLGTSGSAINGGFETASGFVNW